MSQINNNNAGSVIDSVIRGRFGKYKEGNGGGGGGRIPFAHGKTLALVEGVSTKRWIK